MLVDVNRNNLKGKVDSTIESSVNKWLAGGISGIVLKDERYRKLWKVAEGDKTLYIKKFIHLSLVQRLRFLIFKSKARREFENLNKLLSLGINVPTPLGFLEGGLGETSIMFLREVRDAKTLKEHLNNERLDYGQKRELLGKLSELVRALHKTGLENKDLHSGNILIDKSQKLYLIDIHRAQFRGALSLHKKVYELAFLIHSFYKNFTLADAIYFLKLYFGSEFNSHLVGLVCIEFLNIRRRWWNKRSKNCFKVQCLQDKDRIIQEHLSSKHIKDSHNRSLSRVGNYFVKEYRRSGTAKRAWYNAYALTLRDIPVPKCYEFCQNGSRDFIIGDWLDALPLNGFIKANFRGFTYLQRRNFLFSLAKLLRRMHIRGVVHNDMKASNIFVQEKNGEAGFYVLDFDDVDFSYILPFEIIIKNLAQLNASVEEPLTRADRMRFLHYYIGRDLDMYKSRKVLAKDVMAETIKRGHLWP